MGTSLGPESIPYTYMDPLGNEPDSTRNHLYWHTIGIPVIETEVLRNGSTEVSVSGLTLKPNSGGFISPEV